MHNNLHKGEKTLLLSLIKKRFNMKHTRFILVLSCFILIFNSCSTDVDLYADYKDIAIVYAMLNPKADTNYVKIIRAFCGTNDDPIDANEVALIADSSNYPGKLDVRLIELKNTYGNSYEPTGRILMFDTLTLHNKEEGVFYSPDQKVYYTDESLASASGGNKYAYQLIVVKPNGDTITARTKMVGNEDFKLISGSVSFQKSQSNALGKIVFRADGAAPVYDIKMQFNYLEQHEGQAIRSKSISRSFGTKPLSSFAKVPNTENSYYQEYSVNWLFNALESAIGNDTVVNPNHPNVVRYIDGFTISISAAGEELLYHYNSNQAQNESPLTMVTPVTNIKGGYGLFCSRTTIEKEAKLSAKAKSDLFGIRSWGFKEH